jgi:hypothetical protein
MQAQAAGDKNAMDNLSQSLSSTERAKVDTMLTVLQDGKKQATLRGAVSAVDPDTRKEVLQALKSGDADALDELKDADENVETVVDTLQASQASILPSAYSKYVPYAVAGAGVLALVHYSSNKGSKRR